MIKTHNEIFLSNITNTHFRLESRHVKVSFRKQKISGDILEMQKSKP